MTAKNSESGKKGAQRSPWSKGPHADTKAAKASYMRYVKRGKRQAKTVTLVLLVLILTACGQPACDPHPGYRPDGQQCD